MPEDFTNTLNLPKTNFAMRANLPKREPEIYKYWEEIDLYGSLQKHNANKPLFVMHDGPPYANGDIHIGHALNKILKDFIVRMRNMTGYRMPYIHGWDTHGLPIENQMIKKHKVHPSEMDAVSFRALCADFARENVKKQMTQMKRLGSIGDWENSYMTILPRFEAKQIQIFGAMAENGYIYKGMKPVYWCPHDETALAEAEIEYAEDPCESIYVKFPLTDDKGKIYSNIGETEKVFAVIWTTTTWTLPGNLAICVGPDFEYSVIKDTQRDECYIIATDLVSAVCQKAEIENPRILYKIKGSELEGMVCRHPFFDRDSHLIVGDHVTLDSGTGCVHTAPGHGVEDFVVVRNYPFIETIVPVDGKGRMNELAGKYQGLTTEQANDAILADLRESGALLATEKIVHTYPHCWRCKHPVIFRATEQWFCSVEGFKDAALKAVSSVRWMPAWGEVRIGNMIRERKDWCISRQRNWGVPIPIFYCESCEEHLINKVTIDRVSQLFEKEGSNAWYKYTATEILGELALCAKCGNKEFRKETDIMDVWFDSGSSYAYVLDDGGHTFPCDLYLEGNDQYRGWFQSSLLTSVATRGCAPYKGVLTHGFVVDGEGRKMSKSLGNGIDPLDVIKEYGADVLRLWVSSVDYTSDVRISKDILKQMSEIYRKIRNTARILLGNLGDPESDFDPNTDMMDEQELFDIDKWALARMYRLVNRVREAYESYEFHNILHDVHNFCAIDMSKLYIDITKDRLYVEKKRSRARRSAQSAMYKILRSLTLIMAPILAYTAEEIWMSLSHLDSDNAVSVTFNEMPEKGEHPELFAVEERYNKLFDLRDDVTRALEIARADKLIGKSLDAKVVIYTENKDIYQTLSAFGSELSTIFIVSQTEVVNSAIPTGVFDDTVWDIGVEVKAADGDKCDRCWTYSADGDKIDDQFICSRCQRIIYDR